MEHVSFSRLCCNSCRHNIHAKFTSFGYADCNCFYTYREAPTSAVSDSEALVVMRRGAEMGPGAGTKARAKQAVT